MPPAGKNAEVKPPIAPGRTKCTIQQRRDQQRPQMSHGITLEPDEHQHHHDKHQDSGARDRSERSHGEDARRPPPSWPARFARARYIASGISITIKALIEIGS